MARVLDDLLGIVLRERQAERPRGRPGVRIIHRHLPPHGLPVHRNEALGELQRLAVRIAVAVDADLCAVGEVCNVTIMPAGLSGVFQSEN